MALLSDLLLALLVVSFGIGAVGALLLGNRPSGRFVAALGAGGGAVAALALGLRMLVADAAPSLWSSVGSANGFIGLMLRLDSLGAVFLVVIGLVGLAVAIYGYSYTAAYAGRYSLRLLGFLLNVLLFLSLIHISEPTRPY